MNLSEVNTEFSLQSLAYAESLKVQYCAKSLVVVIPYTLLEKWKMDVMND